jgi:hypothetical protein
MFPVFFSAIVYPKMFGLHETIELSAKGLLLPGHMYIKILDSLAMHFGMLLFTFFSGSLITYLPKDIPDLLIGESESGVLWSLKGFFRLSNPDLTLSHRIL